jgi:predicted transcriptional regulator
MSQEIAKILGITRVAVESYRAKAKERLGVGKTALLTRIAIQYKLSSLGDELSKAELKKLGRTAVK